MIRRVRVTGCRHVPELRLLEHFEHLLATDENDARDTQWSTGLALVGTDAIVREHLRSVLGKVAIARGLSVFAPPVDELWVIWDGRDAEVAAEIEHATKHGALIKIECIQEVCKCG